MQVQPWPEEGLERVESCPICGEVARDLLYEGLTDRIFFCAPGRWSLYRCMACGSAFLDPRPTSATIAMAYDIYFTHDDGAEGVKSLFGLLKRRLRNGYINGLYNKNIQPTSKIGYLITSLLPSKRRQIDESVRHLPTTRPPGTLVDIGCGNGQFLRIAMQLGWQAWGVDIDPKAVATARRTGAKVIQGGFPGTGLPSQHFDIVTLSHVIEHVHDPIAAFREIFRILKPDGQIWLATPNIQSFGHERFGADWRGLEPPRHLVLFTRNSLETALISTGFVEIEYKPCPPLASWFYQSSLRIANGLEQAIGGVTTLPLTLKLEAKVADFRVALNPSRCENIVVTAKKSKSSIAG